MLGRTRSLGALPSSGSRSSEAFGVGADGSVIVGSGRTSGTPGAGAVTEAFVLTRRWGMVRPADRLAESVPAGVRLDSATGIAHDGRTVVGTGTAPTTGTPFPYVATIGYCPGDRDDNGALEVQDIPEFLSRWFVGC